MKLIKSFEAKFEYKLISSVYQVASLLDTKKLKVWLNREDCNDIRLSAYANVFSVYSIFDTRETKAAILETEIKESDEEDGLEFYFKDSSYTKINGSSLESVELGKKKSQRNNWFIFFF